MPIKSGKTGTCPHCKTPNRFETAESVDKYEIKDIFSPYYDGSSSTYHVISVCKCTVCAKLIIHFDSQMVYPLGSQRNSAPIEVPQEIAKDFNEACLVESLSNKAAAALGRRCLQNILHEQGIKEKNLSLEIDEAMKQLPSYLADDIDAIRNVGNFSAHPIKCQQTGDIVEVEEGETEWTLDTLERLFDFYYVSPAKSKANRAALNAKLQAAGKPNLK